MCRTSVCVFLAILLLLPSNGYSNLPAALYHPFSNTVKFPMAFLQLRRGGSSALEQGMTRTTSPVLCDECDKSQPNPCGNTGLQCLRDICVAKANDVKICRGDLAPGDLCEICIPELRDCASGLECFMHHCIKMKNDGPKICPEDSEKCNLAVLRQCSGSGPCQRCGGGLPPCEHQLRCVDGRCAANFNKREKCDEDIKKRKAVRQNNVRIVKSARTDNEMKEKARETGGKLGISGKKKIRCKVCRQKSDCGKNMCNNQQKKCAQKGCYNGFCAKNEKMAMRCDNGHTKEMISCEPCIERRDCVKKLCGGDEKKCNKVKCIKSFCASDDKFIAKCVETRVISKATKS